MSNTNKTLFVLYKSEKKERKRVSYGMINKEWNGNEAIKKISKIEKKIVKFK